MLSALAISSSSFGSAARIDASHLLRTLESHSGSTTTARPAATRSAPIFDHPLSDLIVRRFYHVFFLVAGPCRSGKNLRPRPMSLSPQLTSQIFTETSLDSIVACESRQ